MSDKLSSLLGSRTKNDSQFAYKRAVLVPSKKPTIAFTLANSKEKKIALAISHHQLSLKMKSFASISFLLLVAFSVSAIAAYPLGEDSKSAEAIVPTASKQVVVNVDLDSESIGRAIADVVSHARNRAGFVKDVRNRMFYDFAKGRYNVMVFNLSQAHSMDSKFIRSTKIYRSASYGSVIYGSWIFEEGTFTNEGDGGYINWAFIGRFDRNGGRVKFFKH